MTEGVGRRSGNRASVRRRGAPEGKDGAGEEILHLPGVRLERHVVERLAGRGADVLGDAAVAQDAGFGRAGLPGDHLRKGRGEGDLIKSPQGKEKETGCVPLEDISEKFCKRLSLPNNGPCKTIITQRERFRNTLPVNRFATGIGKCKDFTSKVKVEQERI